MPKPCQELYQQKEQLNAMQADLLALSQEMQADATKQTDEHFRELAQKTAALDALEKEFEQETLYEGMIVDHAQKLANKLGSNIDEIKEVHIGPEGELRGVVTLEGKNVLFIGDRLITHIEGGEISFPQDIHTGPEGELRGVVQVDGENVLFIGDRLITQIGGKKISSPRDIHTGPEGELRGVVYVDGKYIIFDGDRLITHIGGKEISNPGNIHTGPEGKLRGVVKVEEKNVLFIDDRLITHIGGKKIESLITALRTLFTGELAGKVTLEGEKDAKFFIGDTFFPITPEST